MNVDGFTMWILGKRPRFPAGSSIFKGFFLFDFLKIHFTFVSRLLTKYPFKTKNHEEDFIYSSDVFVRISSNNGPGRN